MALYLFGEGRQTYINLRVDVIMILESLYVSPF